MRPNTFRQLIALSLVTATTRSNMAFSLAIDAVKEADLGSMTARDSASLFARDDGCASVGLNSDYESCGMGLPNNFCCNKKAGYTCHAFNNNQSAICCPPGQDCSTFNQIQCNTQGLNVSAPNVAGGTNIYSTNIVGGLAICAELCCPIGYTCSTDGSKTCVLSNKSSSPASSTSTNPAASTSNTAGGSSPNQAASGSHVTDDNQCPAYPVPSVLVGFFPGLVLGIIVTIAVILCIGGRNRNKQHAAGGQQSPLPSPDPSKSSVRALVSDPIFHDNGATRSDFLRRMSRAARTRSSPKSPGSMSTLTANQSAGLSRHSSARVRGLFSGSTRRAPPLPGTGNGNGNGGGSPKTPKTPMRQSSTESIVIFSPEHVAASNPPGSATTRDTRWEDVMGSAGSVSGLGVRGLAAPPAFLGSPSIVDPRKKGLDGTAFIRR